MNKISDETKLKIGRIILSTLGMLGLVMSVVLVHTGKAEIEDTFVFAIDLMGGAICYLLFAGCSIEEKTTDTEKTFPFMTILLLAGLIFFIDEACWITVRGTDRAVQTAFLFVYLSELILEQVVNYAFWRYIMISLPLEGKFVRIGDKAAQLLLIPMVFMSLVAALVVLSRMFLSAGAVDPEGLYWLPFPYMAFIVVLTFIAVIRSKAAPLLKIAALSFVGIPGGWYILSAIFPEYPSHYGGMLLSIVVMYIILYYEQSRQLILTQSELKTAAVIQESMLPHVFPPYPDRKEFMLHASMSPAKEVGGDFYDYFMIDEDHLVLVMADVSGKGVPAALFMSISMVTIRNQVPLFDNPADVLAAVNDELCENEDNEMFVTVWLGVIKLSTGRMMSANAGHEYPVFARAGESFELKKTKHGPPLGIYEGVQYQTEETVLHSGDMLFLYTDGLPEATAQDGQMLGEERMLSILNRNKGVEPRLLLERISEEVGAFVGEREHFDDLTMLAFRMEGEDNSN